jgi:DNA-binding NarL/FixJ family response regulator
MVDGMSAPIRVFLLDDHDVVRTGMAAAITTEPDIEVVGDAGDAATAIQMIGELLPDVAVLDVRLQNGGTGIEVCREVSEKYPSVRSLILTSFDDDHAVVQAAAAGAVGFMLKQIRSEELVEAIRQVADGRRLLDGAQVRLATQRLESSDEGRLADLSPQERRIFDLIGQGKTNREIASDLYLAEKTVKNYVSHMLAKLGMSRRTEAAALAARVDANRTK